MLNTEIHLPIFLTGPLAFTAHYLHTLVENRREIFSKESRMKYLVRDCYKNRREFLGYSSNF